MVLCKFDLPCVFAPNQRVQPRNRLQVPRFHSPRQLQHHATAYDSVSSVNPLQRLLLHNIILLRLHSELQLNVFGFSLATHFYLKCFKTQLVRGSFIDTCFNIEGGLFSLPHVRVISVCPLSFSVTHLFFLFVIECLRIIIIIILLHGEQWTN